jgi:hypothetical protein
MSSNLFTDAQLDAIRAIVRSELAPVETAEAAAPEPVYHPIAIHFRDGQTLQISLDDAALATLSGYWTGTYWDDKPDSKQDTDHLTLPARDGLERPRTLCFNLEDVLYID